MLEKHIAINKEIFVRFHWIQLHCQLQKHSCLNDFNLLLWLTQNTIYANAHNANTIIKVLESKCELTSSQNKIKHPNNSNSCLSFKNSFIYWQQARIIFIKKWKSNKTTSTVHNIRSKDVPLMHVQILKTWHVPAKSIALKHAPEPSLSGRVILK